MGPRSLTLHPPGELMLAYEHYPEQLASRSKPLRLWSSGHSFLLLHANAMRVTAFGIAGIADVNIQFSKGANKSAPVHSQRSGRFALIPIDLSKDNKKAAVAACRIGSG
jgi:hypothetical protein